MSLAANLIGDMKTVITNGPSTTTKANAIAAAGPIMDYPAGCNLVLLHLQECSQMLGASGAVSGSPTIMHGIMAVTDPVTDSTNLGLLQGIQAVLSGLTAPSTTAVADIKTVISNGPSTATKLYALSAGGVIMDYVAMCNLVLTKLQEAHQLLSAGSGAAQTALGLIYVTDTGTDSTNKNLLIGVENILV